MSDENKPKKSLLGGIGKRVGNLLFEQTQEKGSTSSSPSPTVEPTNQAPAVSFATVQPSIQQTNEEISPEALSALRAKVIPADSAYTHFQMLLRSFEPIIPDQSTRFRAALQATFAATGTDPNTFTALVDQCLGQIPIERTRLNESADRRLAEIVGGGESGIKSLAAEIASKEGLITTLGNEIRQLTAKKKEVEANIGAEKDGIESKRRTHLQAAETISAELNTVRVQLGNI